jgi:hypothetical protein
MREKSWLETHVLLPLLERLLLSRPGAGGNGTFARRTTLALSGSAS